MFLLLYGISSLRPFNRLCSSMGTTIARSGLAMNIDYNLLHDLQAPQSLLGFPKSIWILALETSLKVQLRWAVVEQDLIFL